MKRAPRRQSDVDHFQRLDFFLVLCLVGFGSIAVIGMINRSRVWTPVLAVSAVMFVLVVLMIFERNAYHKSRLAQPEEEPDQAGVVGGDPTSLAKQDIFVSQLQSRASLLDAVSARIHDQRGDHVSFALLVLDMNRFKEINENFGHQTGDAVLDQLSTRLESGMRPDDLVLRMQGDRFAILAGHVASERQAAAVIERIEDAFSTPVEVEDIQIPVSYALGMALSEDVEDAGELLRRADVAMYRAKRNGRTFAFFVGDLESTGISEVALAASLPRAIANDEFELWFQPKIDLTNERLSGVEALVRWNHPELGFLLPETFLHLIDLSTSNRAFNAMVLEQGALFVSDAKLRGLDVKVALNISVRALYDSSFPDLVQEVLGRHGVLASSLTLEITEQDIMDEGTAGVPPALESLARMGVTLSIDDFGTGYSSLARLRDLPVSEIKIDRRFVGSGPEDDDDRVIVQSIVDLASNLGLTVVAEGVERQIEADMLVGAGCGQAQGFLYGRPMPKADFLDLDFLTADIDLRSS